MCTNNTEICRICMNKETNLNNIFSSTSNIPSINIAIMECAPVNISETDSLPHTICEHCLTQLETAYHFRNLCINSDFALRNKIAEIKDESDEKSLIFSGLPNPELKMIKDIVSTTKLSLIKFEIAIANELNSTLELSEIKSEDDEIVNYLEVDINTEDVNEDENSDHQHTKDSLDNVKNNNIILGRKIKKLPPSKLKRRKRGPKKCPLEKNTDGFYHCQYCPRKYKYKQDLERHLTAHTNFRYRCESCGKEFTATSYLKRHMVIHSRERKYSCEFCGAMFRTNGTLHVHRLIHLDIRRFQCDICEKNFRLKKGLQNHMRTHTGERPFVCETCGKSFNRKHHLSTHKQIHGEKRFKCNLCSQAFISKQNLNQHIIKHCS